MANTKKKTAREKRVLVASLLVAAVMVGGSTFAWFTSKDEVTNRLSASAQYDVSIAEDFQPPEDWVPGQQINKDVSAVNTGNVDAFVRMWLEGEMSVMNKVAVATSTAIPNSIETGLGFTPTVTSDKMYALGFAYKDSNNYYRVLSKTERANANLNGTDSATDDNTYSEVKSVQAGGYLVYAPTDAKWTYKTEQQTEIINTSNQKVVVAKDKVIGSKNVTASDATTDALVNAEANCVIDSDTFTPITPGLYIFRRNIALANANTADTYEYSGYVFDGTNYFALANDTAGKSDYTLPVGAVTVASSTSPQAEPLTYELHSEYIKLYTATETIVKNNGLTWEYTAATGTAPAKLTATYNGGTAGDTDALKADDIVIDVALANIGTAGQTWTAKTADGKTTTFYYNDDVEAGDSTAKLVDSVTLSDKTTQHAFLAFDFDLNVFLESVQVTMTEDGQESTAPITASWAAADGSNIVASGTATEVKAAEIADIAWS